MGTIGLSKANRLFWLGRYLERVYTSLKATRQIFDKEVDGDEADFKDYCRRTGIGCNYTDTTDFIRRYYFDLNNPDSVIVSLRCAYDNAIVLRETLSSETLAYVQMAAAAIQLAAESTAPAVELQWVLDDIMAFRGSCEENIESESSRNIIKSGASLERLDLYLRLGYPQEVCLRELNHLASRLKKAQFEADAGILSVLREALENAGADDNRQVLVAAAEGLITI